jgi:hypothetical protein
MRTDFTTEIDGALAGRDAGSRGYWECARSGNGNMTTDLMEDDSRDYEELEGLGEAIEEMDAAESTAIDQGAKAFKSFREAKVGEKPPYAPKPGKGWVRRRIPTNTRAPGGNRQVRVRWVQISPRKFKELQQKGQIKQTAQGPMLGFIDISKINMTFLAVGAGIGISLLSMMKRKRA